MHSTVRRSAAAPAPHCCLLRCLPGPQADPSRTSIEGYRALHASFDSDPNMTKAVGVLTSGMAAQLGMASKGADLQAALGQEGADALSHLVATAMKAWLQMSGSGQGHSITVGGIRAAGQLRPLNGGRHNVRTCVSPQAPFSEVPLSSLGTISVLLTCRPGVVAGGAGPDLERVVLQEEVVATGQARAAVVREEVEGVAGVQPAHVVLTMGESGSGGQAAAR
jgi:hypothetical protein